MSRYKTYELKLGDGTTFNVRAVSDDQAINELIISYPNKKREDVVRVLPLKDKY